jgi:chromosome segregation ATPase
LERYDADAVRARLQMEHRGVEELTARLAAVGDLLAAAREEQAAEVRALREQHAADLGRLTTELTVALQAADDRFRTLENAYRALEGMSRNLERQLGDMRQSWSWKLTAPLRTAWRRPTP